MNEGNSIAFDETLLNKAKNGDFSAFEKLIITYEKLIFNVAYRIMGNVEDSKDVSQESLLKIYNNINKCDNINHFKSWICTITTNSCIDELRKRKSKRFESTDKKIELDDSLLEIQLHSHEKTPEDQFMNKQLGQVLKSALEELSFEQRSLVVLRDINNLSYNEIADITGLTLGTVKSRLSRARTNMKNILVKYKEQNKF